MALKEYVIVRMEPGVHSVVGSFYDEALAVQYATEHGWSFTVLPIEPVFDLYEPWCAEWNLARRASREDPNSEDSEPNPSAARYARPFSG